MDIGLVRRFKMNVHTLLENHRMDNQTKGAELLIFEGIVDKDVYNITAPFTVNKQTVLAGRVESRDSEHSEVYLFEETKPNVWTQIPDSLVLELQDPFYTMIDGAVVLGGVEVDFSNPKQVKWRTVFYRLKSISQAEKVFVGPWGMKDLRLKQLKDGSILVLTRPQGEKGGRGKIGLTKAASFEELTIELIEEAPLLNHQFPDEIWSGTNEVYEIGDEIWALGHVALFDEQMDRHYYSMVFKLDLVAHALEQVKIIAERKDFQDSPSKRPDLIDVVFSGGLKIEGETIELYAGISDASAQKLTIENPFS